MYAQSMPSPPVIPGPDPSSWQTFWSARVLADLREGVLVEANERVLYINPSYANLLGYDAHELIGMPLGQIIAPDDERRLLTFSHRRVRNEAAPFRYTFAARRSDGSTCRLVASISISSIEQHILITTIVHPIRSQDAAAAFAARHLGDLSEREQQILRMLLADKRPKEIAFELDISEKTVATHRRRIYDKLRFRSAHDMFLFGVEHDLIEWS